MENVFSILRTSDRAAIERLIISGQAYPSLSDDTGSTLLHIAVELKRNEISILELLISSGWDVNTQNSLGATPLHYTALRKDPGKQVAQLLLKHRANPQLPTIHGHTPLHLACERYKSALVQVLLEAKVSPGCVDRDNNTPLHALLLSPGRDTVAREIAELLLRAGARIETKNKDGNDALLLASAKGFSKVCQLLIAGGCNLRVTNDLGNTVAHNCAMQGHSELIDMLLDLEVPYINVTNVEGDTPLHLAVKFNHAEAAAVLIRKGSSIIARNASGKTPIDMVSNDEKNIFAIKHPDLIRLLNSRKPKNKANEEEEEIGCGLF